MPKDNDILMRVTASTVYRTVLQLPRSAAACDPVVQWSLQAARADPGLRVRRQALAWATTSFLCQP